MSGPCRLHGCTAPATVILVGFQWIDERCPRHARQLTLWPPKP